ELVANSSAIPQALKETRHELPPCRLAYAGRNPEFFRQVGHHALQSTLESVGIYANSGAPSSFQAPTGSTRKTKLTRDLPGQSLRERSLEARGQRWLFTLFTCFAPSFYRLHVVLVVTQILEVPWDKRSNKCAYGLPTLPTTPYPLRERRERHNLFLRQHG